MKLIFIFVLLSSEMFAFENREAGVNIKQHEILSSKVLCGGMEVLMHRQSRSILDFK